MCRNRAARVKECRKLVVNPEKITVAIHHHDTFVHFDIKWDPFTETSQSGHRTFHRPRSRIGRCGVKAKDFAGNRKVEAVHGDVRVPRLSSMHPGPNGMPLVLCLLMGLRSVRASVVAM